MLSVLKDLLQYVRQNNKYWILPLILLLLLIGWLLVAAKGSVLAPILYPIF